MLGFEVPRFLRALYRNWLLPFNCNLSGQAAKAVGQERLPSG
jgi:hypothetical protein